MSSSRLFLRLGLLVLMAWALFFTPKRTVWQELTPDPVLEAIRADFQRDFGVVVTLPIGFVRDFSDTEGLNPFTVGVHYTRRIGPNRIEILNIKKGHGDLKFIVYHELGHELGLEHTSVPGIMAAEVRVDTVKAFNEDPRDLIMQMKLQYILMKN